MRNTLKDTCGTFVPEFANGRIPGLGIDEINGAHGAKSSSVLHESWESFLQYNNEQRIYFHSTEERLMIC